MVKLNLFGNYKVFKKSFLEEVLDKTLESLNIVEEAPISLIFSSKKVIAELNSRYRKKNESTDVLSFNYSEKDCKGEIVVYLDRIRNDVEKEDESFRDGFAKVFIHGILHLYNFDHKNEKDKKIMKKKESEIFQKII